MRRENKSCSNLQGSFLMFWKTVRVLLLSAASHRLLRWIELLITFAKHFQFSLASTGLMVVKSAVLHKYYWMDFHKTWIEDGYWPKTDPINSRKREKKGQVQGVFLNFINSARWRVFWHVCFIYSGYNAWIGHL